MELKNHYANIIIGAGPAGLNLAYTLAKNNKEVLLVSTAFGGANLNSASIPLTALINYSKEFHKTLDFNIKKDIFKIINQKVDEVRGLELKKVEELGQFITFVLMHAKFISDKLLLLRNAEGDEVQVSFDKCIIATGTTLDTFEIENYPSSRIITNREFFELTEIPSSIFIFGDDYISIEIAEAMARLECNVTLICEKDLLPNTSEFIKENVASSLKKNGVEIFENIQNIEYDKFKSSFLLYVDTEKDAIKIREPQYILALNTKKPNVKLNLTKALIEYNANGIKIFENFKTTNTKVYAIGSVTDSTFSSSQASMQSYNLSRGFFDWFVRHQKMIDSRIIHCDTLIGYTGSLVQNKFIKKFIVDFSVTHAATVVRPSPSRVLLYVNMFTKQIVRAEVMGDDAANLLHFFSILISQRTSVRNILSVDSIYPSNFNALSEFVNTFNIDYKKNFLTYFRFYLLENILKITAVFTWITILLLVLIYYTSINFNNDALLIDMQSLFNSLPGVILFVLVYILRAFTSLPTAVITLIAGGVFGFGKGVLLSLLAINLSSVLGFYWGKRLFVYRFENLKKDKTYEFIKRKNFEGILVSRLSFVSFDKVSYAAQKLRVNFITFLLASFLGSLPNVLAFVLIGASFEGNFAQRTRLELNTDFFFLGLLIFILGILITTFIKEYERNMKFRKKIQNIIAKSLLMLTRTNK